MSWLTAKHRVKMYCAAVALLGTYGAAMAATDTEQLARIKDPNQWAAPGGNLMLQRYSALKGINADTVKDLQFAWSQSTGALRGHEGQPLVINDVGGKPMRGGRRLRRRAGVELRTRWRRRRRSTAALSGMHRCHARFRGGRR